MRTLGLFELKVIIGILKLKEHASVIDIVDWLGMVQPPQPNPGAISGTLQRLRRKGIVQVGHKTAPKPYPGGRSKTIWELTPKGVEKTKNTIKEVSDIVSLSKEFRL